MSVDTIQYLIEPNIITDTIFCKVSNFQNSESGTFANDLLKNGLTILMALIAGVVALYQVKSNVISSARIRWIEELKTLLSEYYSVAMDVVSYNEVFNKNKTKENWLTYKQTHSKCNTLTNKIVMYLNSDEKDQSEIEKIILKIDMMLDVDNVDKMTQSLIETELKIIVTLSKKIFKTEWDRSKKIFRL